MKPLAIHTVVRTDTGRVRALNEDCVEADESLGLVVLADGMGGYQAGEVASGIAVSTVARTIACNPNAQPATAINAANDAILTAIGSDDRLKGMGTTVVVGRFYGDRLKYAHVGDSRLYLWREGRLHQMTRDHSMMQRVLDEGRFPTRSAALRAGVKANLLTRGVGLNSRLEVDSGTLQVKTDDLFLFCSDGLSNMLSGRAIERVLRDCRGRLDEAADRLLTLALERGGYDNISMALVAPVQLPQGEYVRGGDAV